ncbi:hypothetical protein ACS0TY_036254 [Phlomoides rotata]
MSETSTASFSPPKPLPSPEIPAVTEPSAPQQITSLQQQQLKQPSLLQKMQQQMLVQVQLHRQQPEQKDSKMAQSSTASSSPSKPLPSPKIPAVTEPSAPQQNTSLQQQQLKQSPLLQKMEQQHLLLRQQLQLQDRQQQLLQQQLLHVQKDSKMSQSSNASSSPSKPLPSLEIPTVPEQSAPQQNTSLQQQQQSLLLQKTQQLHWQRQRQKHLKQSLQLQNMQLELQQQQLLQEQHLLQEQEDSNVKRSIIGNNLSGVPNFQGLQRNIPAPKWPDEMQGNNKYQQQNSAIDGQMSSGGINSTQQQHPPQNSINQQQTQIVQAQQPMVQPLQQTGSHNLTSQFRAKWLALDALAATQGQNALTSGLTQNGQPSVIQNSISPQPWFKQMQVVDSRDSSLDRHRQHQQFIQRYIQLHSQRMVGPGDQKSVCLTGSLPDNATPGGSSSYGTEASNQFIRKRMIHDVVSQLDLNGNLDPEVKDHLSEIAGNFIDSVTKLACTLTKHPKSPTSDSKDVLLHPGGSKQENSKNFVRDFSDRKPQAVYCHCGLEATAHTASIQSKQGTGFWCCSALGAQRCGFFEWCDPEMSKRCNETMPGILRRMNAQDATINGLKIRHGELCMALVICVVVMLFMVWDRFVEG